jgi:hypothetical protein
MGICHLGVLGICGRIILKLIMKETVVKLCTPWTNLHQDTYWWWSPVRIFMSSWNSIKYRDLLNSWASITFSRRSLLHGVGWGCTTEMSKCPQPSVVSCVAIWPVYNTGTIIIDMLSKMSSNYLSFMMLLKKNKYSNFSRTNNFSDNTSKHLKIIIK